MKIFKLDCKKRKERQRSQAKHTCNGISSVMLKIVAKNIPMEPFPKDHESYFTIVRYFMLFLFLPLYQNYLCDTEIIISVKFIN